MTISMETCLLCDGEDLLDVHFRCDDQVRCEGVVGGFEVEGGDYAAAEARTLEIGARDGWATVDVPELPAALEDLWNTKGGRTAHLCRVCEATRRRVMALPRTQPETAWDTWTDADVRRRAQEIVAARSEYAGRRMPAGDDDDIIEVAESFLAELEVKLRAQGESKIADELVAAKERALHAVRHAGTEDDA